MEVVERAINEIFPYENNPRKNEKAIAAVAASLKEFGFQQPIVVDKDGVIIVGHTRYKAAIELGFTKVPVTIADMTSEKAKAYRILDNKLNEIAEWDFGKLDMELVALQDFDFELFDVDFGFMEPAAPTGSKAVSENISESVKMVTCPDCGKVFPL